MSAAAQISLKSSDVVSASARRKSLIVAGRYIPSVGSGVQSVVKNSTLESCPCLTIPTDVIRQITYVWFTNGSRRIWMKFPMLVSSHR